MHTRSQQPERWLYSTTGSRDSRDGYQVSKKRKYQERQVTRQVPPQPKFVHQKAAFPSLPLFHSVSGLSDTTLAEKDEAHSSIGQSNKVEKPCLKADPEPQTLEMISTDPAPAPSPAPILFTTLDEGMQIAIFRILLKKTKDVAKVASILDIGIDEVHAAYQAYLTRCAHPHKMRELWNTLGEESKLDYIEPDVLRHHMGYFVYAAKFEQSNQYQRWRARSFMIQRGIQADATLELERPGFWFWSEEEAYNLNTEQLVDGSVAGYYMPNTAAIGADEDLFGRHLAGILARASLPHRLVEMVRAPRAGRHPILRCVTTLLEQHASQLLAQMSKDTMADLLHVYLYVTARLLAQLIILRDEVKSMRRVMPEAGTIYRLARQRFVLSIVRDMKIVLIGEFSQMGTSG